jgi:hypothetical protein
VKRITSFWGQSGAKPPLTTWRTVVQKAAEQAEEGDAKAREWLGKILLGENPTLVALVERLRKQLERLRHANPGGNGQATGGGGAGDDAGA